VSVCVSVCMRVPVCLYSVLALGFLI